MIRADVTCKQVIQAADKEIAAQKKQVQLCQLGVQQITDQNTQLTKQVQDKDKELGRFWRNPFVMLAAGALIGIYVARR